MTPKNRAYAFLALAIAGIAGFIGVLSLTAGGAYASSGAAHTVQAATYAPAVAQATAATEATPTPAPQTGSEEQGLSAANFSRNWIGHFDGLQSDGSYNRMKMELSITDLAEDGALAGKILFYDLTEGGGYIGSYYVTGEVDWGNSTIALRFDRWADQGVMQNKRVYAGTIDASGTNVTGTCEFVEGFALSSWEMTAA